MPWQSYRFAGYAPDLPADAQPPTVWSLMAEAVTRDGVAERFVGANDTGITGACLTRPQWAAPCRTPPGAGSVNGIFYAGNDFAGPRARLVQFLVGTGHGDLTAGTGWAATPTLEYNAWTGGPFSAGVLIHDVTHEPLYQPGSGAAPTVLSATLKFNALRPYKYMAVGISDRFTANSLNTVRWTASAAPGLAPGTFVPAAGNDAGSVDLTSGGLGLPVDGGQLGEDFIIYGENAMWLMTYVGGATVMTIRRISSDTGVPFRNLWCEVAGGHVAMTNDDIVLVNQTGVVKSLVDGRMRRRIFANDLMGSSTGKQQLCQIWSDRRRGRVYVVTPGAAVALKLVRGYCLELASDTWSEFTLSVAATADDAPIGVVTANLGAGLPPQPQLYVLDQGQGALSECDVKLVESNATANTRPVTLLQKDDLDLGDASAVKVVRGVRIRATSDSAVTVKVTVGSKMAATEAYTYGTTATCVLGSNQFCAALSSGRWFSIKIESNAAGDPAFRCHGFDLEYTVRGNW